MSFTISEQGLQDRRAWEAAGFALPRFDREKVMENTKENPFWIHFGAGPGKPKSYIGKVASLLYFHYMAGA